MLISRDPTPDRALLQSLAQRVLEAYSSVLTPGEAVALLDFPDHENVGDSLIWLGQRSALRALRVDVDYATVHRYHNPLEMARRINAGAALIQGGGNFGDLWPNYQRFRESLWEQEPHRRFVQLPQSVWFSDSENERRAASILREADVKVLVRDRRSEERLTSMGVAPLLVPDSAFVAELPTMPDSGGEGTLWVTRNDHEGGLEGVPATARRLDWIVPRTPSWREFCPRVEHHSRAWLHVARGRRPLTRIEGSALLHLYDRVAERRVVRGMTLLRSAKVIVSDRLHVHVLCLLLGIPHVVVSDRFGKVARFREEWTASSSLAHDARDGVEAAAIAADLLREA